MDQPRRLDLRSLLTRAEAAAPVGVVDAMAAALREMLDAREVSFLIADFSGRSLNRLGHTAATGSPDRAARRPRGGCRWTARPTARRSRASAPCCCPEGDDTRVIAPVTSRGEAVGVLELVLPFEPARITLEDVELAAHQLAYMVIANRRYTDLFEWGQRTVPMSLAAEIQRRLLPASFTCEADQFTLAGWLEPAGEVGGDTFDFSLDRNTLHMSMTDAMGHSVDSALLATLVVGALRNTRRRGASLVEQAQAAHEALLAYAADGGFVTGQLVRVDLVAQTARVVNAGHPRPFRLRDGGPRRSRSSREPPFGALQGATLERAGAPARGRRPRALPDRRHARAQCRGPRHPGADAGQRAPASARGDPAPHARGPRRRRRRARRRRHIPVLRLARRRAGRPRYRTPAPNTGHSGTPQARNHPDPRPTLIPAARTRPKLSSLQRVRARQRHPRRQGSTRTITRRARRGGVPASAAPAATNLTIDDEATGSSPRAWDEDEELRAELR